MAARFLSDTLARTDRLPADVQPTSRWGGAGNVLADFVEESVPWSAEPTPVPRRLRRALWAMLAIQLLWVGWLGLTAVGAVAWSSPLRAIATLGQHGLLLGCSAACLVGLAILALLTRGFVTANAPQTAGLIAAAGTGGVALLGLAALVLVLLLAAVLVGAFLATFTFRP